MEDLKPNIDERLEEIKKLIDEIHQHLSVQDAKLNYLVELLQAK